jgi:hypothetical protein
MTWTAEGMIECDNHCGSATQAWGSEAQTIEVAIVQGWGYSEGFTGDGKPYEAMICPRCRTGRHRVVRKVQSYDDTPLWEM